ncbi:MAG: hypothetical protein ABIB97_00490 [Patescibacteria group bacterium]
MAVLLADYDQVRAVDPRIDRDGAVLFEGSVEEITPQSDTKGPVDIKMMGPNDIEPRIITVTPDGFYSAIPEIRIERRIGEDGTWLPITERRHLPVEFLQSVLRDCHGLQIVKASSGKVIRQGRVEGPIISERDPDIVVITLVTVHEDNSEGPEHIVMIRTDGTIKPTAGAFHDCFAQVIDSEEDEGFVIEVPLVTQFQGNSWVYPPARACQV